VPRAEPSVGPHRRPRPDRAVTDVLAPPPQPPRAELEALIEQARARRRRRRLLAAGTLATGAGLALGIHAVLGGIGGPGDAGNSRVGGVPLCRGSQISLVSGGPTIIGPLRGRQGLQEIENRGGSPCSLPQHPPAARITWHSMAFRVRQKSGRGVIPASWLPLRAVHVLESGGKAAVSLEWDNWCGPPHSFRPMTIAHLRFDRALTIAFSLGPRPPCTARAAPSTIRVSRPLLVRG
jgi:hypothetical protein